MKKILTTIGMSVLLILCIAGTLGITPNISHSDIMYVNEYIGESTEDEIKDRTYNIMLQESINQSINDMWEYDEYYSLNINPEKKTIECMTGYYYKDESQSGGLNTSNERTIELLELDRALFDIEYPRTWQTFVNAKKWLNQDGIVRDNVEGDITMEAIQRMVTSIQGYTKIGCYYITEAGWSVSYFLQDSIKYLNALVYFIGLTDKLPGMNSRPM